MNKGTRKEKDVIGEIEIPIDAYWGSNTQRAIQNFNISGKRFPQSFIFALAQVKKACLLANMQLGLIDESLGKAILQAVNEIIEDQKFVNQFPVDIFQTGSGTQTNMNMNEVLANRANEILGHLRGNKHPVHPNDHVNKGQSSNDVIPTTMHIVSFQLITKELLPALEEIIGTLHQKIIEFKEILKVGRTHLQDAVPIPLSLEFSVYLNQLKRSFQRLKTSLDELCYLPIGGTVLGTGLNTHEEFDVKVIYQLEKLTGIPVKINPVKAEGIASHNTFTFISSILKSLSLSLMKIANDIRWMASGPKAGLGELILPVNEPGSSIMPGKINPTQSEMLIQVCIQVIGNDSVISLGEAHGSILDLNVSKPLIITNLIESITLLSNGINSFNVNCLEGLEPNKENINRQLEKNTMLITNLNKRLGYDEASKIAFQVYKTGKTIKEVVKEFKIDISEEELDELLDPKKMV